MSTKFLSIAPPDERFAVWREALRANHHDGWIDTD
jgi:hypothetical protein